MADRRDDRVYAKTLDPEQVDWDSLLEPYTEDGKVVIEAHGSEVGLNHEVLCEIRGLVSSYLTESGNDSQRRLKSLLPLYLTKEDKTAFNNLDVDLISQALESLSDGYHNRIEETNRVILGVLKGMPYRTRCLHGATVYVPTDMPDAVVDEIVSLWDREGTVVMVHDDDQPAVDPMLISGPEFHTQEVDPDAIRKVVAEECSVDPKDVVLWVHEGYTKVPKYKAYLDI